MQTMNPDEATRRPIKVIHYPLVLQAYCNAKMMEIPEETTYALIGNMHRWFETLTLHEKNQYRMEVDDQYKSTVLNPKLRVYPRGGFFGPPGIFGFD